MAVVNSRNICGSASTQISSCTNDPRTTEGAQKKSASVARPNQARRARSTNICLLVVAVFKVSEALLDGFCCETSRYFNVGSSSRVITCRKPPPGVLAIPKIEFQFEQECGTRDERIEP